jgi:hypothetical protein
MNRQACKGFAPVVQLDRRKILREQQIADFQLIVKCTSKSGADQKVELPVLEKFCDSLATSLFSNAGMKDFDHSIIQLAAYDPHAIAISARSIAQTP